MCLERGFTQLLGQNTTSSIAFTNTNTIYCARLRWGNRGGDGVLTRGMMSFELFNKVCCCYSSTRVCVHVLSSEGTRNELVSRLLFAGTDYSRINLSIKASRVSPASRPSAMQLTIFSPLLAISPLGFNQSIPCGMGRQTKWCEAKQD